MKEQVMQIQNCRWNLCENHFRWENQLIGLLFFTCAPFSSRLLIFVQNWTPVLGTLRIIRWAVGWHGNWKVKLRTKSSATQTQLWPCERKLNEEKSKPVLAKWFWPAFLHVMLRLVKGTAKRNTSCWLGIGLRLVKGTAKLTDCCELGIGLIAEAGKRHSKA